MKTPEQINQEIKRAEALIKAPENRKTVAEEATAAWWQGYKQALKWVKE